MCTSSFFSSSSPAGPWPTSQLMGTAVRNVCIFESDFMNIFYFLKYINGGYMLIYKWRCIVVNTGKGKGEWNWGSQIWTILRIYLACLSPFTPVLPLTPYSVRRRQESRGNEPGRPTSHRRRPGHVGLSLGLQTHPSSAKIWGREVCSKILASHSSLRS